MLILLLSRRELRSVYQRGRVSMVPVRSLLRCTGWLLVLTLDSFACVCITISLYHHLP